MDSRMYRSRSNSKLTGLCAGLGEWMGVNVTFLRFLFVMGVLCSGFTLLIPYFIVALVVPKEPLPPQGMGHDYAFGPGGYEPHHYNF